MKKTLLALLASIIATVPSTALGAGTHEHCSDPLGIQVRLDRSGFSPGVIDGRLGRDSVRALKDFQAANNLPSTGAADCATWKALSAEPVESTISYTISDEDARGPFVEHIPVELGDQATLPALSYQSLAERLSERFHTTPAFLQQLNPHVRLDAGASIVVPNVAPFDPAARPQKAARAAAAKVEVTREGRLTVQDAAGRTLMTAPVSSGSEHDPLPPGDWKVTVVDWMPAFHYNPDLFWDAAPEDTRATIKPGPNNPVGVVWIGISKEHYGIHGTPEPSRIGRTESHGCVRLTNWDAARLAGLVSVGTPVIFK
jgi:lipoprotein-anchoring transpeptidase ErfK/SrfK